MNKDLNIDITRFINKTILSTADGKRKSLRLHPTVANILSDVANDLNKKGTQGVVGYEYLMMYSDELTDDIDFLEQNIDQKLRDLDVDVELLNSVTYSDKIEIDESVTDTKRRDIYIPDTSDDNRIQIQLNQFESLSQTVQQAILDGYHSIYTDRFDRIEVKQALHQILSQADKDATENEKAIKLYETSDEFEIPTELQQQLNYQIQSRDDYVDIADDLDTWHKRYRILHNLVGEIDVGFDELVEFVTDTHDLDNETYVKNKLSDFCREYDHKEMLEDSQDETTFDPDIDLSDTRDEEVKFYNYSFVYEDTDHTLEEVVYRLIQNNGGKILRDGKFAQYWDLDRSYEEFYEDVISESDRISETKRGDIKLYIED